MQLSCDADWFAYHPKSTLASVSSNPAGRLVRVAALVWDCKRATTSRIVSARLQTVVIRAYCSTVGNCVGISERLGVARRRIAVERSDWKALLPWGK